MPSPPSPSPQPGLFAMRRRSRSRGRATSGDHGLSLSETTVGSTTTVLGDVVEPGSIDRMITDGTTGRAARDRSERSYRRRVLAVDSVVVIAAVALAQICGFHLVAGEFLTADDSPGSVTLLSIALAITWLSVLGLRESRDISLVGVGADEYNRVVSSTLWVFGITAVTSLVLQVQVSRSYLVVALSVGLVGLVTGRHVLRRRLAKRRTAGAYLTRVVVLGKADSIAMLCERFGRSASCGYTVAGVCIPDFDGEVGADLITAAGVVPVLGDEASVESALRLTKADAIAIAATEHLGHEKMRKLAWRLDSLGVDMIVVPGMADIAGPRLRLRPIDNLPLFHIARPRYTGPSMYRKRIFDVLVGSAALLVAVPILLTAAMAIKLDDGGPVFFRQDRVGHLGKRFRVFKLRTMSVDAEARKEAEQATTTNSGAVFFKSAMDSRITRVGRFLRATSVDELPQLFNVLGGSMSLVGPRPLVPGEGDSIEHFVEHRGLVKPGMTGLWQISGRSSVSDEDRIRLDHSYVDNWSCVDDMLIVWRTVRVVLKRQGAY